MDVLEMLRTSMWIVAAATAIVTIGLGAILGYHWSRYSGDPRIARFSILTYSAVSLILLLAMVGNIPA